MEQTGWFWDQVAMGPDVAVRLDGVEHALEVALVPMVGVDHPPRGAFSGVSGVSFTVVRSINAKGPTGGVRAVR